MGMIISIAIRNAAATQKIQVLKKQINQIINQHKHIADTAKRLSELLKELDFGVYCQSLSKMNTRFSANLGTIVADQQLQLDILSKLDVDKIGVEPNTALQNLLQAANLVGTVCSVIATVCATNPITIVVSGIMLIISGIFSIFSLMQKLEQIKDLEAQKKDLQEYYAPGGKFEQDLKQLADTTFKLVENFYIFVVTYRTVLNQLSANINLLMLSERYAQTLDFLNYSSLTMNSVVDEEFQIECLKLYKNISSIQNRQLEEKINMSCKYLEDFERNFNIQKVLRTVKNMTEIFTQNPNLNQALEDASVDIKKLTSLRDSFKVDFEKRKDKTPQELERYDRNLFDDMLDEARKMQEKELSVIELVSFYTTQFYADDLTGQTLCSRNLKELNEKTQSLKYLGLTADKANIIYVPEPAADLRDAFLYWNINKTNLIDKYRKVNGNTEIEFKRMYIRMQCGQFEFQNEKKSKLSFFYGMEFVKKGETFPSFFEVDALKLYDSEAYRIKAVEMEKVERIQRTDEDLNSLCTGMEILINAVAYPERVTNFQISKEENVYRAVLEWQKKTVNQEFFGKILKVSLEGLSEEANQQPKAKSKVFYQQFMKEEKVSVVFGFK